ncbi:MAG: hypothetical protein RL721_126 [Candidatus Eisenbacteria bacterium]|jgi:hypothetical protein
MNPTRWVLPRALSLSLFAAVLLPAAVSAQSLETALNGVDLASTQVARSPRLLGMGGLSIAVRDKDNQTNLWDFAGIPVGLGLDDSVSTVELRPGTGSLSSVRDLPGGRLRENMAARGSFLVGEGVYRNRTSGGSFGVVGDLSSLRWDVPYSGSVERRQGLSHPQVLAVLGGVMPRFLDRHLQYALHLGFRSEKVEETFRSIITNDAGEWIGGGGDAVTPPSEFEPTDSRANSTRYGVSTAYSIGRSTKLAVNLEREIIRIRDMNELVRSTSEMTEDRPWLNGQAALVGRLARDLEYGLDGSYRMSDSERDWRFTASAGVGAIALTGRGNMFTRSERIRESQARLRWTPGRAVFAGQVATGFSQVWTDPPKDNDPTSLNRFINEAFNRPGADTLALPDSIGPVATQRNALGVTLGASHPIGSTLIGVEYRWTRDAHSNSAAGLGPRRVASDVRVGVERPLGQRLMVRGGYVRRSVDEDDYLNGNEYVANAYTIGLGYSPANAAWTMQAGYQLEFRDQDYADPGDERQSRQNLALKLRWEF